MSDVRERIQGLVESAPVVLFMKGTRREPQCGFSSRVVDVLDDLLEEYRTIDVLADPTVREGIKAYSEWPTIPQLYVHGRFVGGADIVSEMMKSGELAQLLGSAGPREVEAPEVFVSEPAVAAFKRFAEGDPKPTVRIAIDRAFETELDLAPPEKGDHVIDLGAILVAMDAKTAQRASGLTIDFVDGAGGSGFKIENPNKPPRIRALQVEELAAYRKEGKPHLLIDVRTPEERATASIEGSVLLDAEFRERLADIDRATPIVLHCHHGSRSRTAAEHCLRLGFQNVANLEGGIDAWSLRIDPAVPRY